MPTRLSISSCRRRLRPCGYACSFTALERPMPYALAPNNFDQRSTGMRGEDAVLVKDAPPPTSSDSVPAGHSPTSREWVR